MAENNSMTADEANAFLRKAVADLVQYCRIQVGYRADFNGWISEATGKVDRDAVEHDEHEGERFEAKHVLFSCHVAEKLLALTANDLALKSQFSVELPTDLYGEYPETIKQLESIFNTSHYN